MEHVALKTWRDRRDNLVVIACDGEYHTIERPDDTGTVLTSVFIGSCPGASCKRHKLADVRN